MVPQFRVGFETHSKVTIMRQEGKLSALSGNLATVGTDKTYNRQRSYVEASAILDAGMEKEDFQALTNELHQILLDEFKKQLKDSTNWPSVPKDRFDRRVKFLDKN